jgi:hypothetical protein
MHAMRLVGLFLAVFVAIPSIVAKAAEETVTIPLEEIWALNMPGTQNVYKLDPGKVSLEISNEELRKVSRVAAIKHVLTSRPRVGESVGPAFVVNGTGAEALKNAHAVILDEKSKADPRRVFPPNSELSIVLYAHCSGRYIWIRRIWRAGGMIRIQYSPMTHETAEATVHLALIPLGKLPEGVYRVKVQEMPTFDPEGSLIEGMSAPDQTVSRSFSFELKEADR